MKALGGSFEIESVSGKGTTARLTLPFKGGELRVDSGQQIKPGSISLSEALPQLPIVHTPLTTIQSARIRVLLVDDHTMVRQGLRSVLDGYAEIELVGEAGDGEEAVAFVHRLRPSVVIMDISMPKKNGIEATAEIKAHYPDITVIGLSVNAGGENQEAMKRAGASILLTKEAAVEKLYDAIQKVVNCKQF